MNPVSFVRKFVSLEFLRFVVVGSVGFVVDFGSYIVMTRFLGVRAVVCYGSGSQETYWARLATNASESCTESHFPLIIATMISVVLAIFTNFLLNKYWTFRKTAENGSAGGQAVKYFSLNIVTYVLNQLLVGYFVANLALLHIFPNFVDVLAKMLAVAIILFLNYFGSKLLVFRKQKA